MEFIRRFREYEQRVLCNIILDKFTNRPFKQYGIGTRHGLALIMLFLLFEIIELSTLIIIREPILPVFAASLLGALVSSLSIYVVSWCYQYTLEQLEEVASVSNLGEGVERRLISWLKRVTNPWRQLLTTSILTISVTLTTYVIDRSIGLPFKTNIGTFIALSILVFCVGQGGYWAIVSPFITKELRQSDISEITIHSLYPNKTPILVGCSKALSVFAIWDAIIVTLCLMWFFALHPDLKSGGMLYVILLVFIGYMITSWTFLYAQLNLAKIVQRAKRDSLFHIQIQINKLYKNLESMENSDFERMKNLMELHQTVNKAPNTVISFSGLQSFIGSLITPTVVAIIGVLDWNSIFQRLLSILP